MPELPDVEVFKRYLDSTSLHQTIQSVHISDDRILEGISVKELRQKLRGRKIESSARHGKHLLAHMDDDTWLTLHFGMTGRLKYFKKEEQRPAHGRFLIDFSNGYHLAYISQRMLGEVGLVEDAEKYIRQKKLGPDALDINHEGFMGILKERKGSIKSSLMNQKWIAGIGNIYADEILFRSRVHPETKVNRLSRGKREEIFQSMKSVLKTAIDCQADPRQMPSSYLLTHRKKGQRCPRSHGELKQVKVAGRTSYFCTQCQRK
ncbi:MAG: DNA-formamidopyrimidine glycosylase family protein [Candidatus Aminicenantes bacterium]|jgi:formamidopyrimidine-DNA glycosylase